MFLFILNIFFFTLGVAAFWLFLRTRLPVTLEANPQKWNFAQMEYSLLAPVLSPRVTQRANSSSVGKSSIVAILVVLGAILVAREMLDWILTRYMPLAAARDWQGVTLLVFMSYIGLFVALGQAYAMYIVYKRSKALGAKMTIKEFSRSTKADVVSKVGTILR